MQLTLSSLFYYTTCQVITCCKLVEGDVFALVCECVCLLAKYLTNQLMNLIEITEPILTHLCLSAFYSLCLKLLGNNHH